MGAQNSQVITRAVYVSDADWYARLRRLSAAGGSYRLPLSGW
jgi:hypothetical protein